MTLPTGIKGVSRRDLLPLAALALVLGAWIVWVGASGAYSQTVWYPCALGALSLWVAIVAWSGRILPEAKPARLALLAFVALVGFNYLSILWAGSPGSALDASNELTLYLLVAWILVLLPWTPRRLAVLLGLWSLGICAFCAVDLIRAVSASSLSLFFVDDRFATPMQYSNATGALAVMGMWPALILSSRRELTFWLRGCCLGVATFLAAFSTLPQSRAALLGLIVTAVLGLVVCSDRARLLSRMLVVGGGVALCLPRTIAVNNAVNAGRRVESSLHHAAAGMLIASLAAVVLGIILGLLEDRLSQRASVKGLPEAGDGGTTSRRPSRLTGRRGLGALSVTVLVLVVIGGVALEPQVAHLVHTTIHSGNTDAQTGSTRLISTSPEERFDYARVALHLFSGAPILGIGSGNFGRRYDALRRFPKHSSYTHNLPLRVLSETGILGTTLFLLLIGALVVGMVGVARRRTDLGRACVAIAFTVSGYFLVHSCLDWVDQFPALAAPAIGIPLAAIELGARDGVRERAGRAATTRRPLTRGRLAAVLLTVTGAVAVFVALTTSYLSLQYIDRAFATFRATPQQAYHDLDVARSLSPLSADPLTSAGTVALYAGDLQRSQSSYLKSVQREDDWFPRLELALLDAHAGRFAAASTQLDAAAARDADDPLIGDARTMIQRRQRINPIAFNAELSQEGNSAANVQQTIR